MRYVLLDVIFRSCRVRLHSRHENSNMIPPDDSDPQRRFWNLLVESGCLNQTFTWSCEWSLSNLIRGSVGGHWRLVECIILLMIVVVGLMRWSCTIDTRRGTIRGCLRSSPRNKSSRKGSIGVVGRPEMAIIALLSLMTRKM